MPLPLLAAPLIASAMPAVTGMLGGGGGIGAPGAKPPTSSNSAIRDTVSSAETSSGASGGYKEIGGVTNYFNPGSKGAGTENMLLYLAIGAGAIFLFIFLKK